jgi:hypothetical protein
MVFDVTSQFVPIFWGMVAALLALFGALLASVDPEVRKVDLRNPGLRARSTAAIVGAVAALLLVGAEIAHGLGALLPH